MNEETVRLILSRLQEIKEAQFILVDQVQSIASQTQEKLARIELELSDSLQASENQSGAV